MSQTALKQLELFVQLVQALAWPLLILLLFVFLQKPLRRVLAVLPEKISESKKLTVGGLSFELQETAKAAGNPELAQLIGGLSTEAIKKLLRSSGTSHQLVGTYRPLNGPTEYFLPSSEEEAPLLELERQGLLQFTVPYWEFQKFVRSLPLEVNGARLSGQPLDGELEKRLFEQGYELTPLGQKAFELVIQAVASELKSGAGV